MEEMLQSAKKYLILSGCIMFIFLIMGTSMFASGDSSSSSSSSSSAYVRAGETSDQIEGLNLYNSDGSVNEDKINQLEGILTNNYLNTEVHYNYEKQTGPFEKYWGSDRDNTLAAFQCTWWVDGRADQFMEVCMGKESRDDWFKSNGNGGAVVENAKNAGWTFGNTPEMNSIISFQSNTGGHVAYVEAVDANGDIYVSHAGSGKNWMGITKISPNNDGTYSFSGTSVGFIYLSR